ncbi:MAG TPA: carbohydrate kinase family protein [Anaerolineae bacterium]|nr:carbohydrate kinase family protein [Anaerolineae bacterium]
MAEAVVIGDINVDVLVSIPAYPRPGGDALAERIVTRAGGSAANTAIALSKLGVTAKMIGRVGRDVWADIALPSLVECGVDVADVQRDEHASTGLFFIAITPDGERTMFGLRGANARTDPASIAPGVLDRARLLHVSGYALLEPPQRDAALRLVDLALQRGVAVSLDTGLQPALAAPDLIRRLLPRLSLCVLGMDEARALIGIDAPADAAAALVDRGVKMVGLKLGAQGCLAADASRVEHLPAFEVAVVDTTGAGDAFSAGMIFGWLRGSGLPATGTLANALGALAAMVWGAGPAMPGRAELLHMLRDHLGRETGERANWIAAVIDEIGE